MVIYITSIDCFKITIKERKNNWVSQNNTFTVLYLTWFQIKSESTEIIEMFLFKINKVIGQCKHLFRHGTVITIIRVAIKLPWRVIECIWSWFVLVIITVHRFFLINKASRILLYASSHTHRSWFRSYLWLEGWVVLVFRW